MENFFNLRNESIDFPQIIICIAVLFVKVSEKSDCLNTEKSQAGALTENKNRPP